MSKKLCTFLWSTVSYASRFLGVLWWKSVKSPTLGDSLLDVEEKITFM